MRVTGPGQPVYLLADIVDLLNEIPISYAVIGALAVSFHGIPRATNDADAVIWLHHTKRRVEDLSGVLTQAGYHVGARSGDSDDPIVGVIEIEDGFQNRMDLLLGIRGMDPDAIQRCTTATFLGHALNVIGAEDLIALKTFAGGPQDIEDVKGILQVSKEQLDIDLLRSLANRYGKDVLQKLESILVSSV